MCFFLFFSEIEEKEIDLESNSTKSVEVGSRVELECRSDLNPPVAYAWSRAKSNKGIPIGATIRGSTLILPKVNYKDAGIYICKANNTGYLFQKVLFYYLSI